ncbi:MAG: hypothetical protein VB038_07685 [Methanobrevibacter sp.]|nr:hypothetical protein [Methanobrevibacter sp.]MEA4957592.1 hypothetical protein [Methanobrevibacter sp.]
MKFRYLMLTFLFFSFIFLFINSGFATQYNVNNQSSSDDLNNIISSMQDNDVLFFGDGIYQNKSIYI